MEQEKILNSMKKSGKSLYNALPVLLGVILLVSLANAVVPKALFSAIFTGNYILDPLVGGILGSILAGNPVTSYILGGEFLKQGISLVSVTAFLVAWVTVGIVQLPAESTILGKKFAIFRNLTSFIFAIVVAVLTVFMMSIL